MMPGETPNESSGISWAVFLASGIVVVAAAAIAVRFVPQLAPVRRYAQEAEDFAIHLPEHARTVADEARERLARAQSAFRLARAESERVLIAQFEEAKQRGSVPPA